MTATRDSHIVRQFVGERRRDGVLRRNLYSGLAVMAGVTLAFVAVVLTLALNR